MHELVMLLKEKKITIASCESLTAGLFASSIASIPGASSILQGALVTYQNEIKETVAHVDKRLIDTYGVISQECAIAMACNTRDIMKSDVAVSFTGNAGPSTMEGKDAGLVYCAIASDRRFEVFEFKINKERNELRNEVVKLMCHHLIHYVHSL